MKEGKVQNQITDRHLFLHKYCDFATAHVLIRPSHSNIPHEPKLQKFTGFNQNQADFKHVQTHLNPNTGSRAKLQDDAA